MPNYVSEGGEWKRVLIAEAAKPQKASIVPEPTVTAEATPEPVQPQAPEKTVTPKTKKGKAKPTK